MSHAPDMSMPHAGDILGGRYVLVDRIGAGGMGRVFRARDEVLRRDVAVKIFFADRTDEAEPARRMSEARALAALDHPSLVTLYDARLDTGDHVYLVMELIDGPSLQRRIEQGPVATAEVAGILSDLAGALAVVHDAGIVHRDVKPSNVLLRPTRGTDRGFEAVLADFGVAHLVDATRLTTPGTVIGTAAYLAPEQVRGEPPRAASDVYALGLLAIEALTRLHPFGGGSLQETLLARLARQPDVPTTLGYAWRSLLVAMTANDPDVRPTAADVSERASALADGLGGTALETGPVTVTVASPWAQLGLADTGDAVAARADTPTAVVAAPVSGLTEASSPARSAASPADPAASSGSVTAAPMIAVEEDRPATPADAAPADAAPADAATASAPTGSPAPGAGARDVAVTAGATPGVDATDALSAPPVAPPVESSTVPAVSPALTTGDDAPRALGDAASPRADVVSRRSHAASAAVPSRRRRRRWVMGAAAAAVVVVGVHVVAFALGAAGDPYTTVGVPDPGPSVAASTPTPAATPVAPSDDRASNVEQVSTRNDEATTIAEEAPVDGVPAHPTPVDGAPDDLLPAGPPASASNPGVANGTGGKTSTGTGNGATGNGGTGNAGNGNGRAGGANVGNGNGNGNGGGAAPGRSGDSGKGANGSGNAGPGPSGKDGAPGKK